MPALADHGVIAEPRVWDDSSIRWGDFRLVVIRSTWDYADRRDAFLEWCSALPHVLNDGRVIRWNTDKAYLRDLASAGVPIVPTTWVDANTDADRIRLPAASVVVKPSVSSGARNTSRYGPGDEARARAHVRRLVEAGRTVMVQPYMESVDASGETGLIFIDGAFSHAIRKGPLLRAVGIATDQLWAPEEITPRNPDADELSVANAALDALPWPRSDLLYARVDLVRDDDGAIAMLELELTEPSLFLRFGTNAADRFARAIVRRLGAG